MAISYCSFGIEPDYSKIAYIWQIGKWKKRAIVKKSQSDLIETFYLIAKCGRMLTIFFLVMIILNIAEQVYKFYDINWLRYIMFTSY